MPCFHPITAFKSRDRDPGTGRYGITFNATHALIEGSKFEVPCGKCQGCRVDRSREWAVRCTHESQMHEKNCFLTLTFNDDDLPDDYSIHVRTLQLFMKSLRDKIKTKIRFYAVGEYGDKEQRPHYHALIFGYDFNDKILYSNKNNKPLYTSPTLSKIWTYGFSTIGPVNYQTAAYCARYSMKKLGGEVAFEHYFRVHPITGKMNSVTPEFSTQSRRPGIGKPWFLKYKSDVFPSDFLIVDRKKHPVPKAYIKWLEEEERRRIKINRGPAPHKIHQRTEQRSNNTPARRAVREEVFAAKISKLKRDLK